MLSHGQAMVGSYDFVMVALSVLIAVFASYAALNLAGRVNSTAGRTRGRWLFGGALSMGFGIWSMHYVGMLAFRLPVPVAYDWPTVLASLLAAIFASAVALFVASRRTMGALQAIVGGLFMGAAISGMHYIGMAAMRMPAMCSYSPVIVSISVAIAVAISLVALRLTFLFREESVSGGWRKVASAIVMGAAVASMHYTGMAAASFTPSSSVDGSVSHALSISSLGETGIVVVTFMVLATAILTSMADRRLSAQATEIDSNAKRSRQILETCFDSFIAMDAFGKIMDWNAQAENTFGWSVSDVTGKTLPDVIIPPGFREVYNQHAGQALHLEGDRTLNLRFETRAVCRDGREIPVEFTISAAGSGPTYYCAAFVRDLGRRYRAEEKFRGLLESSSEAILFVDTSGRIAVVNSQAEKLFGYSRSELLQQSIEMLIPARLRENHVEHRTAYTSAPQVRSMGAGLELYALRNDGTEFPVEISLSPLEAEEGPLVSTVISDITARKERELALTEAHESLRMLLEDVGRRAQESAKLAEMLDILQSCLTVEEACKIAGSTLPIVLPSKSGALCLTSSSRNLVHVVASWGQVPATEGAFSPGDCWALRRGKFQRAHEGVPALRCPHVTGPENGRYLCIPLTAQGETLGVLFVECLPPISDSSKSYTDQIDDLIQQSTAAGERLSLALANLKLREVLRTQSIRDPLTGLFNRRYMEETLQRELSRARRNDDPLSFLMFDIDHFKRFNDTFGHQAGDALLRAFGEFLLQKTRGQDVACRYGGEEFALILSGAAVDSAHQKAELLRESVKQLEVQFAGQPLGVVTVSIGVAAYPQHTTPEELLRAADGALYRAKAEGRDRVVVEDAHAPSSTRMR